jgi:hypothetical protein
MTNREQLATLDAQITSAQDRRAAAVLFSVEFYAITATLAQLHHQRAAAFRRVVEGI